jgi:nucleoside-diphosphate-sugar epimerase
MSVVLVTGALGWLGKRLVRLLTSGGYDHLFGGRPAVRALVLAGQDQSELRALGAQTAAGDIRNPDDCRRFCENSSGALLVHAAGIIHPRRVREFFDINVTGARNLIEAAIAAGVARLVAVSSNSPLGCNPHPDHLFDEDSPYNPYMGYGRSKMQMELAVREAHRDGRLQAVIVRPPWFYGPDQPARQTLFFQMIRAGRAPLVDSGENLRSMAYIDNLCQGIALAATHERAPGNIYWIADRRPYAMREVIGTVERLLEFEFGFAVAHRRLRLPGFASTVAQWVDASLQSVGFYEQKFHVLSEMNKTIACTVEKAVRELGYQPEVELEEGMRRSIRWCLDQGITL